MKKLAILVFVFATALTAQVQLGKGVQIGWPGISFKGAWSSTTTYTVNDAVFYDSATYVSIQTPNLNQNPATATAYWTLLVEGGGGTDLTALHGDGVAIGPGDAQLTVTKTNGTPFAASATTDTTNASNIASGTVADARLSSNVPLLNGANAYTGTASYSLDSSPTVSPVLITSNPSGMPGSILPMIFFRPSGVTPSSFWDQNGTGIGFDLGSGATGIATVMAVVSNGTPVYALKQTGDLQINGSISNLSDSTHGAIKFGATTQGVNLSLNQPSAIPAVRVQQINASSTGDITDFDNSTGTVARIKLDGTVQGSALATTQTPATSTATVNRSVPITLNGTVYYILLSTTP